MRLRQGSETLIETAERVPQSAQGPELLVITWSREEAVPHTETLTANASHRSSGLVLALIPLCARTFRVGYPPIGLS